MLSAREVADDLLVQLRASRPAAGEQLASDAEVAERYGVTKNIARHAWLRLARDGHVVRRQGEGTFMADTIPAPTTDDRVAQLEVEVAELQAERGVDRARLIEVYARLGMEWPGQGRRGGRRTG